SSRCPCLLALSHFGDKFTGYVPVPRILSDDFYQATASKSSQSGVPDGAISETVSHIVSNRWHFSLEPWSPAQFWPRRLRCPIALLDLSVNPRAQRPLQ